FAVGRGRLDQDGAGAIAEQHAGGAVLIVDDRTHDVAADDQGFFVRASAKKLRADGQGVDEAGASAGEVEAPGVFRAQAVLNETGGGGEHHVRRDAGDDDEVNLLGSDVALG